MFLCCHVGVERLHGAVVLDSPTSDTAYFPNELVVVAAHSESATSSSPERACFVRDGKRWWCGAVDSTGIATRRTPDGARVQVGMSAKFSPGQHVLSAVDSSSETPPSAVRFKVHKPSVRSSLLLNWSITPDEAVHGTRIVAHAKLLVWVDSFMPATTDVPVTGTTGSSGDPALTSDGWVCAVLGGWHMVCAGRETEFASADELAKRGWQQALSLDPYVALYNQFPDDYAEEWEPRQVRPDQHCTASTAHTLTIRSRGRWRPLDSTTLVCNDGGDPPCLATYDDEAVTVDVILSATAASNGSMHDATTINSGIRRKIMGILDLELSADSPAEFESLCRQLVHSNSSDMDIGLALIDRRSQRVQALSTQRLVVKLPPLHSGRVTGRSAVKELQQADCSLQHAILSQLWQYEWGMFSQNGEDGVLAALVHGLPRHGSGSPWDATFVEFGAEDGSECNTRLLQGRVTENGMALGGGIDGLTYFDGLLMDGGYEDLTINLRKAFLTAENIIGFFEKYGVAQQLELLSVDVDFNDFWLTRTILEAGYKPRVLVVEVNAHLPPNSSVSVPYDASARWNGYDRYFGASVLAFASLGRRHGYELVYCETVGVNAFFIHVDALAPSVAAELVARSLTQVVSELQQPPNFLRRGRRYSHSHKSRDASQWLQVIG